MTQTFFLLFAAYGRTPILQVFQKLCSTLTRPILCQLLFRILPPSRDLLPPFFHPSRCRTRGLLWFLKSPITFRFFLLEAISLQQVEKYELWHILSIRNGSLRHAICGLMPNWFLFLQTTLQRHLTTSRALILKTNLKCLMSRHDTGKVLETPLPPWVELHEGQAKSSSHHALKSTTRLFCMSRSRPYSRRSMRPN